jgi:AcrR family transcriptional regulator
MPETSRGARTAPNRSRSDRSAATRARILDAVVASIDEVGFARTTSQQIARYAGVSVGAVQHHFPSKEDILAAVLDGSVRNLEAQFEGVHVDPSTGLAERIDLFTERAWGHYGSAAFRGASQILANARELAPGGDGNTPPIVASARGAARLWNRIFGDIQIPERRQREVRQFAFAALTGMAAARRFQSGEAGARTQLEMLKTALGAIFEQAGEERWVGSKQSGRS